MEREILFRGLHINNEGHSMWLSGSYVSCADGKHYIMVNGKHLLEVMPETIGQYVGLKDKDGQKIFEGDIVKFWTRSTRKNEVGIRRIVEYGDGCFLPFYDGEYIQDEQGDWVEDDKGFTIIGNIHENPGLLK